MPTVATRTHNSHRTMFKPTSSEARYRYGADGETCNLAERDTSHKKKIMQQYDAWYAIAIGEKPRAPTCSSTCDRNVVRASWNPRPEAMVAHKVDTSAPCNTPPKTTPEPRAKTMDRKSKHNVLATILRTEKRWETRTPSRKWGKPAVSARTMLVPELRLCFYNRCPVSSGNFTPPRKNTSSVSG